MTPREDFEGCRILLLIMLFSAVVVIYGIIHLIEIGL
jgi:hypothetical protein